MFGRKSGSKADKKTKTKVEKKVKVKKTAAVAEKTSTPARVRSAGPLRKQPTNIYTVLLLLALLSMLVANVLMWLELFRYGSLPQWSTT